MRTQTAVLDTFTVSGDPIDRARQALEFARHQVRVAQADANWRLEGALVEAEEAVGEQLARIDGALADAEADAEEAGETERQRRASYPRYRAA